jgi:hypothetical protein
MGTSAHRTVTQAVDLKAKPARATVTVTTWIPMLNAARSASLKPEAKGLLS